MPASWCMHDSMMQIEQAILPIAKRLMAEHMYISRLQFDDVMLAEDFHRSN